MPSLKLATRLAAGLAVLFSAASAAAQPAPVADAPPLSPPQLQTDVGGGVHVLSGALDNTTVIDTSKGLVLVDDQFAPRVGAIRAAILTFSNKPVIEVINTHYHGDHTGGNAALHGPGVRIVAHESVAGRMRAPPPNPVTGLPDPSAPPEALPDAPYRGAGETLQVGGVTLQLIHPPPAHTDGDTVILLPAQDVVLAGDLVGNHYPNIDVPVGGSIDGMIAADDMILTHVGPHTRVIPGHGPVLDRAGVLAYRAMLQTARDRIAAAKARGLTERQVMDGGLLADLDPKWKMPSNPVSSRFPINVYRSLP